MITINKLNGLDSAKSCEKLKLLMNKQFLSLIQSKFQRNQKKVKLECYN